MRAVLPVVWCLVVGWAAGWSAIGQEAPPEDAAPDGEAQTSPDSAEEPAREPAEVVKAKIVKLRPLVAAPEAPGEDSAAAAPGVPQEPLDEETAEEAASKHAVPPVASPVARPPAESMARPGHRSVRSVRLLEPGGGRVDGSVRGGSMVYDRLGEDGRYDIWRRKVDDGAPICVTCERYEFRKVNAYNPVWHPGGEYLAIQVQTSARRRHLDLRFQAGPYRALGSELWIIDREGRNYWQITKTGERGGAVLDPYFSFEGDRILWSERITNKEKPWGEWGLRVAEFKAGRQPKLGKIETHRPTSGLLMAYGFAPDDRSVYASAALSPGLEEEGLDLVHYDLEARHLEPLTESPDQRDGVLTAVPRSDLLIWVTDRGLGQHVGRGSISARMPWRGDLWLRNPSGNRQERLTFFNQPGSDHYRGDTLIDDLSWTDDGRLLIHVVSALDEAGSVSTNEESPVVEAIYLLELGEGLER